jgi:hypothetical protein
MTTQPDIIDERGGFTSASNAEYDLLCQGRHLAQKGKTAGPESADASHGRLIHDALRTGDTSKLSIEQHDIYESCVTIENKLLMELFPEMAHSKEQIKAWREERLWVTITATGHKHSAKPDVVYRFGQRALIIEYKTLAGEIPESPKNQQLRDQAVLVSGNKIVSDIAVAVIQPLVTHSPEVCYYAREDLKRAETEMFARVNASHDPTAKRTAGEAQCKFCLARNECADYQKFAGSMVPHMLSLLDVPVVAWSPDQRAMFLDKAKVAQKWLDETQSEMKRLMAEDPHAVTGYILKPGVIRESVTNAQGVYERFSELGGTAEQFLQTVTVKKGELKEQLSAVTKKKGKELNSMMSTLLEGMVEAKQTAPTIEKVIK